MNQTKQGNNEDTYLDQSEYVTIGIPPFFRPEGKPPSSGFPSLYYNKLFFSLQYIFPFIRKMQFLYP